MAITMPVGSDPVQTVLIPDRTIGYVLNRGDCFRTVFAAGSSHTESDYHALQILA